MNQNARASAAWSTLGKTHNTLLSMTEDELAELAELVNDEGVPVDGFRMLAAIFLDGYYDARKSSVSQTDIIEENQDGS